MESNDQTLLNRWYQSGDAEPGNLVIAGRIVDVNGGPIKGAFIQALGQGISPHARTNEDGLFRQTGLSAGQYTRHISLNGYEDQHQSSLKAGNENVLIVLQRKRSIGLIKALMHNLSNYIGIGR